tara:strand:- start:151 stop:345 length:195 start_codon:yes stop_codon:yes gene_type:complete
MINDMPYAEAQIRESARDLIQLWKVHQVSDVELVDKVSEALVLITDADPQEAERVVLIVSEQEK